jgi:hypothetical protein
LCELVVVEGWTVVAAAASAGVSVRCARKWVGRYRADGIAEGTLSGRRLVVRRTRLVGSQAELFPDWRYHAFITDRAEPLELVEADHRRHAQIELAIRDLKQGSGLNHAPSGHFFANAAWLLVSSLAHNLTRWIARLGLGLRGPIVVQTIRRRYLTLPGRITRSARRATLHLPARWPWREPLGRALRQLRALPLLDLTSATVPSASPQHTPHPDRALDHRHDCVRNPQPNPLNRRGITRRRRKPPRRLSRTPKPDQPAATQKNGGSRLKSAPWLTREFRRAPRRNAGRAAEPPPVGGGVPRH